ncbi:hypothetical protein FY528_06860 [Hymenobacter lutimineralis]|uniref:Outer membrane beta-barrel protein n=1 Tax=Hymenobacter lutimineralis TaxID=2606448 RepID=A0A5D6V7V7_9BACT|nr:hypothetical protein [Hymenobacter lutimineralis]TYZ11410.1 hypothetical protein FY528_06860 [Hymenobacter lutimineralis]
MIQRLFLAALAAMPLPALAAPGAPDTEVLQAAPDTLAGKAASAPPTAWYRPRHLVLQTGGGLGMVAAGAGYTFWRDHADLDILVGYVPKKYAGSTLSLASAKFLYSPWVLPVGEKWQVRPLMVGAYFSYTHGTINDEEAGQYTKGYYWFSTDTRVGPLLGSRIGYRLPETPSGRSRLLSAYYELSSNDLYLISYAQNRSGLSPADVLVLSLGLKLDF